MFCALSSSLSRNGELRHSQDFLLKRRVSSFLTLFAFYAQTLFRMECVGRFRLVIFLSGPSDDALFGIRFVSDSSSATNFENYLFFNSHLGCLSVTSTLERFSWKQQHGVWKQESWLESFSHLQDRYVLTVLWNLLPAPIFILCDKSNKCILLEKICLTYMHEPACPATLLTWRKGRKNGAWW